MFGLIKKRRQPVEVVDVKSRTLNSFRGNYFIGQTDALIMEGQQQNAWGGVFNPAESGVILFLDIFAITNFSSQFFNMEIWVNPKLTGKGNTSSLVHPANLTLNPPTQPKVKLQYASQINEIPIGGVNVSNRIVPPNSTFMSDSNKGGIVIPPGGSFAIFLKSPGPFIYESRIVFRWWEEKNSVGGQQ
ncbi:hypothetical protein SAMN04487897_106118 [Paenibacillus sp. yr247]|uniref:DUF6143 family protein n=1 Tax=Paenibacillus sp. yr247 TaxID=1761880 RepID=UPI00088D63CB|nr:DUF6143 family protein [Paenibacillus sp. yr247]SDN95618.1 hypothetical protein SAMN04487897_106118 [Paenibacillus sp. yr247]